MAQSEIITIGTELLLGEIQDTNTRYLACQLRQIGVDLFRVTTVGDNTLRIAEMIRESLSRADIVITTGGLGPTIDDPTRNAVAIAFNVDMVFHADLWKQIETRFRSRGLIPSENNKKQAYLPGNAIAIHNPVGTAPAFYVSHNDKFLVCLPGVPGEMETIFSESVIPLLKSQFALTQIIKPRVIHTSGMGESVIDNLIADLERSSNPTVGLSAHPGRVDIRITVKADSEAEANKMLAEAEGIILQRLPGSIYGFDDETQLNVIARLAFQQNLSIHIFTLGFPLDSTEIDDPLLRDIIILTTMPEGITADQFPVSNAGNKCFVASLEQKENQSALKLTSFGPESEGSHQRVYNGPPSQAEKWAVNMLLDFIWRKLT